MIVFGSEYRTANGLVKPGISAHKLLLGGGSAIAVAPAGLRSNPALSVNTVGVIDEGDPAARQTAESLAGALGATVAEHGSGRLDLLVVGSRKEAPEGKVVLSAASDYAVEAANYPVLVIPRGVGARLRRRPAHGRAGAHRRGKPSRAGRRGSRPRPRGRGCRSAPAPPRATPFRCRGRRRCRRASAPPSRSG